VNLIPIDYFTAAFMAIMEGALAGGVFHIVNGKLSRIEELIDYTRRFLGSPGWSLWTRPARSREMPSRSSSTPILMSMAPT